VLLDFCEYRAGLECVSRVEGFLGHEDLLHDPLTIDDERRAPSDGVLFVEDAVGSANVSLGVAQNGELRSELLGERRVGPGAVDADPENHRITRIELTRGCLICRHFTRAARGECRGKEGEHDVLLTGEVAEFDLLALTPAVGVGGHEVAGGKVRRCLSNLDAGRGWRSWRLGMEHRRHEQTDG